MADSSTRMARPTPEGRFSVQQADDITVLGFTRASAIAPFASCGTFAVRSISGDRS